MKTAKHRPQTRHSKNPLNKKDLRTQFQSRLFRLFFFSFISCLFSYQSKAQYSLVGDATSIGSNCYRLTPDAAGKVGAIWNQSKITLDSNFEVEGSLYFGTNDGNGADGIGFVFQPICSGLGGAGGGIGFYGVSPSFAAEFDTWQNGAGELNDPSDDHIALIKNGDLNHWNAGNLYGPVTLGNIENGAYHSFKIRWTAATQTLEVTFDNIVQISHSVDAVHTIFNDNPNVYWGFTAATGSLANEQSVCISSATFTEQGSFVVTHATCPNYSNGAIDLDVSGMIQPVTFLWNTNSTNEDLSNLTAGTYTVTLTDSNSCESHLSIEVDELPDNVAPFITCPSNLHIFGTSYTVTGNALDPVLYGDVCSEFVLSNNYNSDTTLAGATFGPGTTTVVWNISDVENNTNTCSVSVTVSSSECGAGIPENANIKNGNVTLKTQTQMDAFFNSINGKKWTKVNGDLIINGNDIEDPIVNFCNLKSLTEVSGYLLIQQFTNANNPTHTGDLAQLTKTGRLTVITCPKFENIRFDNLSEASGSVIIRNNIHAKSITLPKLQLVGGEWFHFIRNHRLENLVAGSASSTLVLAHPKANVTIQRNGDSASASLTMDFNKIKVVNGDLLFNANQNGGVSNFDQIFSGLDTIKGKLTITDNSSLNTCCIAATAVVIGNRTISGNTGNCANLSAVSSNCGTLNKRSKSSKTSTKQISQGISFNVYPNPNSGLFGLDILTKEAGTVSIIVTDLMGRTVLSQSQKINSDETISLDMHTATAGQYILKAELNGQVYIKKVVLVK